MCIYIYIPVYPIWPWLPCGLAGRPSFALALVSGPRQANQPGFCAKGLKGTLTKDTKDTLSLWCFRLTLLGETQFFFPRIMIPQRVKEIHGFLEQTLHLDAAHLILTREGYGKAGPAPWKLLGFTGDLVIERRYWKPVNPTIIMILVDLQFGGSIPTISGEIRSIDVYSLLLALPCSATLHVFC